MRQLFFLSGPLCVYLSGRCIKRKWIFTETLENGDLQIGLWLAKGLWEQWPRRFCFGGAASARAVSPPSFPSLSWPWCNRTPLASPELCLASPASVAAGLPFLLLLFPMLVPSQNSFETVSSSGRMFTWIFSPWGHRGYNPLSVFHLSLKCVMGGKHCFWWLITTCSERTLRSPNLDIFRGLFACFRGLRAGKLWFPALAGRFWG